MKWIVGCDNFSKQKFLTQTIINNTFNSDEIIFLNGKNFLVKEFKDYQEMRTFVYALRGCWEVLEEVYEENGDVFEP